MKLAWPAAVLSVVLPSTQSPAPDLRLESRAPSIELSIDNQNRLAFHNLSSRGVTDFQVNNAQEFGTRARPKINPGGTFYWPLQILTGAKAAVLQAVLFDDRSYEGDLEVATELAASQIGREAEIGIVRRIVRESKGDDGAAVSLLREEVQTNKHQADPGLLADVRSAFPSLPVSEKHLRYVHRGMEQQRAQLELGLSYVTGSPGVVPGKIPLARWLRAVEAYAP